MTELAGLWQRGQRNVIGAKLAGLWQQNSGEWAAQVEVQGGGALE